MHIKSICSAFGLGLDSNVTLPFLPNISAEADLVIRYQGLLESLVEPPLYARVQWRQEDTDWVYEYQKPDGIVLRLRFQASGTYLSINYSQSEMADIFPFLMGPGLAAALHLRGVPLLHGASVVMEGSAIMISGVSGMGKSTLTAMLTAAGLALLTEDLTPITISGHEVKITSGYPGLQLHADAACELGYPLNECPKVFPGFPEEDKHWIDITRLPGGFHANPAPLHIIYVLSGRRGDLDIPEIKPLPPTQACLALLEHLYGLRWLNLTPQQNLNLCARLAERVQVRRVWTPEGLDTVADTAQALIYDARSHLTSCRKA
jgi:hypothetical protein